MKRSLGPAALLGLGAGLLGGAIYLMVTALRRGVDCADLSLDECQLEQQAAVELGRYQVLVAVAFACSAVAIFLLLRAHSRKAAPR